ncbi:MAG: hypothetical protein H0X02_06150 [Nitrosomonas sp.]|nr:hypothetical protein [Nitrosomonas sp.]
MPEKLYYDLDQAVKFLTPRLRKPISKRNLLEEALDKDNAIIRLCMRFDGTLSKFSIINETITCEDDYGFVGYIQIPKNKISMNN